MFPEGRNDSPKYFDFQSDDLILEPGGGFILIPLKYVGDHLSFSNLYWGSKAYILLTFKSITFQVACGHHSMRINEEIANV